MDTTKTTQVADKAGRPDRRRWLLLAAAAVVVVAVAAGAGLYRWQSARAHQAAISSCQEAASRVSKAIKAGDPKQVSEARAVQSTQVADVKVVTAFSSAAKSSRMDKPASCDASMDTSTLTQAAQHMDSQANERERWSGKAAKAAQAVLASRDEKNLADARQSLKAKIEEGSARLAQTDGQVADNATREQLQQAVNAAGQVNSSNPGDYQQAQAAIQAALDAVNASAEAQMQAQAAAAQAAAPAPSPAHRNGGSYAPGTPHYSNPAPAAPAAPSAPGGSGGDDSWREKLQNQQQVGGACNSAGVCGIG